MALPCSRGGATWSPPTAIMMDRYSRTWPRRSRRRGRTSSGWPISEETSTRPVGRCLTSVYLQFWRASLGTHSRHGCPVCSVALSGQAPTPHSGAPKARGWTAKARTEQSSALPQCAWLSNTVREIEYQFLHLYLVRRGGYSCHWTSPSAAK